MREVTGEAIKNNNTEREGGRLESARMSVGKVEQQAANTEQEERDLQIELLKAEAAAERREEAERKGKETKEKVDGIAG